MPDVDPRITAFLDEIQSGLKADDDYFDPLLAPPAGGAEPNKNARDFTRVEPLKAGIDGQDLPQSGNEEQ